MRQEKQKQNKNKKQIQTGKIKKLVQGKSW